MKQAEKYIGVTYRKTESFFVITGRTQNPTQFVGTSQERTSTRWLTDAFKLIDCTYTDTTDKASSIGNISDLHPGGSGWSLGRESDYLNVLVVFFRPSIPIRDIP